MSHSVHVTLLNVDVPYLRYSIQKFKQRPIDFSIGLHGRKSFAARSANYKGVGKDGAAYFTSFQLTITRLFAANA